jgi:hypothetical protein
VNKSALLIATTLNVSEKNIQNVVRVLGVHPKMIWTTKIWWQLANHKEQIVDIKGTKGACGIYRWTHNVVLGG